MAKKTKKLSVRLTDKEQIWAIVYLLASYFLLPQLLGMLNAQLPTKLNDAWINFLYFTINFLFVFWIFSGFFKRSLSYAGKNKGIFLLAILAGFAAYWLSNWGLSWLLSHLFPKYANLNDGTITVLASQNFIIMFIGTVIFVPIAEEALHRGLIFGCLYPKNHAVAYILSTIIFACVHIMGYVGLYETGDLVLAFVQYVPAGLILAWAYRYSGTIFAPIVIHAIVNTMGMLAQR